MKTESNKPKKNREGISWMKAGMLAVLFLLAVTLLPGRAEAAQEDDVWLVYNIIKDSSGEVMGYDIATGYVVDFEDSSGLQVYTDIALLVDESAYEVTYWLYSLDGSEYYELDVYVSSSDCGMLILDFKSTEPTKGILTAGVAKENMEVDIIGVNDYGEAASSSATITSCTQRKSGDVSWYVLGYSGSTDDFYLYAMALVDEDSNIVGMITTKGAYAMYAEFPSSLGDLLTDYWWVLLIAAVVIVFVVAVAVGTAKGRKKGTGQSAAGTQQTPVTPPPVPANPEPPVVTPIYPTAPPVRPTNPEPQPARATSLVGIQGIMAGRTYPIGPEGITIGRDTSNVIVYPTDTKGISRKHCRLYFESDGGLRLVDCGSSYGTVLVGLGKMVPLQPVSVKPGDRFYIGSEKNGFELR